jgi:hypothetical protein
MNDDRPVEDARFEDGLERPLKLRADGPEDLRILSALVQDAVTTRPDMAWLAKRHRFTLLLNRFRWEDSGAAARQGREFERVRSLLDFRSVLGVRSDGIDPQDRDAVLSLLALAFEAGEDGTGEVRLTFAGDGALALRVECIDATLVDVTRPYAAISRRAPAHPAD